MASAKPACEQALDVNRASREALLRTPGLSPAIVDRLLAARRGRDLRCDDLYRLIPNYAAVQAFVRTRDWRPAIKRAASGAVQLDLFAA
jgi:predicted DNA-binding helix-hairpin-helix protein